jgi:rare lipoprotein A
VTNLDNGRSVVVTITDRGPFVRGRIIDVSRKAAGQLGFLNKGVTRVGVRVIESSRS